jgi:TRAP transporter TAXI family solute receptor
VIRLLALCLAVLMPAALPARAADGPPPITIRAGKADSANHALAVQFAEAVANGTNGALTLVIEESQGSVQNVMDAPRRSANYVFTTAPNVIVQARRGDKPFKQNARYGDIRALFPIPPLTMHWVVRADSGIQHFADLAGKPFIPGGKGGFAERQTASLLHVLGLEKSALLIDMDAAGAPAALANKQAAGLALAGPYPIAALAELGGTVPLRLLSLSRGELAKVLAADDSLVAQTIPKGIYPGIDDAVASVALPAGAYTTTRMSSATAYAITKAFWTERQALAERNPAWAAVTPAALDMLGVKLHKGALRYYREVGVIPPPPQVPRAN